MRLKRTVEDTEKIRGIFDVRNSGELANGLVPDMSIRSANADLNFKTLLNFKTTYIRSANTGLNLQTMIC